MFTFIFTVFGYNESRDIKITLKEETLLRAQEKLIRLMGDKRCKRFKLESVEENK